MGITKSIPIRQGERIPWAIGKGEKLRVPSEHQLKKIIALCNALLNSVMVKGNKNQVHLSEDNAIFELESFAGDGTGTEPHPFEIMTPNQGTDDWLNIQVNQGYLWQRGWPTAVSVYWVDNEFTLNVSNFNTDITIPSGAADVVIAVTSTAITATDSDPGGWISYPSTDNNHFVIGHVDSTNTVDKELVVTQIARENLIWPYVGETNGSATGGVMVYQGAGGGIDIPGQTVITGTIGAGFPSKGLYIYTGSGLDVGPGSNWIKIADLT